MEPGRRENITMRRLTRLLLLVVLLAAPDRGLAASEPPLAAALFDAIAVKVGVRPTYSRVSEPKTGAIAIEGFKLSIRDPAETNNRDETTIQRVVFDGVRTTGDGFDIDAIEVTGVHHNLSIFSMEVLQIGSLFSELGVDPPGSPGMAVDETIEISRATGRTIRFLPAEAARDGLAGIRFREIAIDVLGYSADSGAPLVIHDIAVAEARKRSAGETWSYRAGRIDLTAPWLEKIAGSLFAELGYGALAASMEAETFRLHDLARMEFNLRADGAFRVLGQISLDDTPKLAPSVDAILAEAPKAAIRSAELAFVEGGMTKRAMALLARQSGAQPQAIARALAQQADSALRRAGYRRLATEMADALGKFLLRPTALKALLPPGPLATLAGMNGTNTPAKLEAAGLTITARP